MLLLKLFLLFIVNNSCNCLQYDDDNDKDPLEDLGLIYPGTKWCGVKDIAKSLDDLGELTELDMCCREHDKCPDTIRPSDTKHNLRNEGYHTRLSCDCDEKFMQCLLRVNSFDAWLIGDVYFNQLNSKCFRNDYPIEKCLIQKKGLFNTKCLIYQYDDSGEKIYQWFDVKEYEEKRKRRK